MRNDHKPPVARVQMEYQPRRPGYARRYPAKEILLTVMDALFFDNLISSAFDHGLPVPHDLFDDFLSLTQADRFHLITSYATSPENHWLDLDSPNNLIPFMWVRQPKHCDYYCFDTSSMTDGDCAVAVFAIHAIVHDWPDFDSFLQGLRIR